MKPLRIALICATLLAGSLQSHASITHIGEGDHLANLVINFSSGGVYEFRINFSDLAWTGKDLLDYAEELSSLVSHQQSFDFGGGPIYFLDGLEFAGHSNVGFGGGDDWWHYWVRDGDTGVWEMPGYGFSDRTISHGSWDGWVYGSANPPMLVPEPGTLLLMAFGLFCMVRRRLRSSAHIRCAQTSP